MSAYRYRSAVTGRFVKAGYAKRYPHLTVRESIPGALRHGILAHLGPLIELQARYNRVATETPFGSQNYRPK